jgi:hypothetical protein
MVLQPARREHEVIADAVVERERRLDQADRDDEREQRDRDRRDRNRETQCRERGVGGEAGERERHRAHDRKRGQVSRQAQEAQTAERQSDRDDRREGHDRRANHRAGEPGRRGRRAREMPCREQSQAAEEPEGEAGLQAEADVPGQPGLGRSQRVRAEVTPHDMKEMVGATRGPARRFCADGWISACTRQIVLDEFVLKP